MIGTTLSGVERPAAAGRGHGALHLAVSRSAAARLAPVAAAFDDLGVAQNVLQPLGASPAAIATAVETAIAAARPAFALIAGDGDAAVAAAMAAYGCGVPIARIGAGLRSDDRGVEREINRIVLDELATRLYADGDGAAERLLADGCDDDRVVLVGNTAADAVARSRPAASGVCDALGVSPRGYVLVALHEPENLLDGARLALISDALATLACRATVVLSVDAADPAPLYSRDVIRTGPLDFPDFLALQASAAAVVTDSGAIQEETTVLGVACFTLADASERTLTLTHGTNVLLGSDPGELAHVPLGLFRGVGPIPLWDGRAAHRIAADLAEWSGE